MTTTTIGVAIAVPEPWGSQLQDYRLSLGDPHATGIPTHITLMPPFEIAVDDLPRIEKHLVEASTCSDAFRIHLRGTGTFRPVSPVVFVTVVEGISGCERLAFAVRRGPLETRLKFPYHPHVTVAHHVDDEALDEAYEGLAGFVARFRVQSVQLFCRDADGRWRQDTEFPLGTAGSR